MFFNRRIPLFIRESYHYDSRASVLWGIFYGLSLVFFPVIARKIGANSFQIALLTAAPLMGALFTLYWSRLSNRSNKMQFFIWIKILARTVLFLMFFAVSPWAFIIIVFLNVFFEQAGSPAYTGIMKEIYPDSYRGRAMGYIRAEQAISAIFACYIGGVLLDRISYGYIFPLAAIIGLLSLVFFAKIKVKNEPKLKNVKKQGFIPSEAIDIFKKDRRFFIYSLIFFTYGFGNLLAMPLYPIFLVDILQASNSLVGKLGSLSSLFCIISYIFWGRYIDKKGPLKSLTICFLLSSFIPLLYSTSFNLSFIILASIIFGLNVGSGELSRINYIIKISKTENVQTYWGIDFTLMGVRGLIAPFIGVGLMNLLGIRTAFFIAFAVVFTSFILIKLFRFSYGKAR